MFSSTQGSIYGGGESRLEDACIYIYTTNEHIHVFLIAWARRRRMICLPELALRFGLRFGLKKDFASKHDQYACRRSKRPIFFEARTTMYKRPDATHESTWNMFLGADLGGVLPSDGIATARTVYDLGPDCPSPVRRRAEYLVRLGSAEFVLSR
jgi:hypothetical protein